MKTSLGALTFLAAGQHAITICNEPITSADVIDHSVSGGSTTCEHIGFVSERNPAELSDLCFPDGSSYNNSFAIQTQFPFLLRRMQVSKAGNYSSQFPDFIRLNGALGGATLQWYKSPLDQDGGAAWSKVPVRGDIFDLGRGIPFSSLSVYLSTDKRSQMRFSASLYGCPLSDTQTVEYVFQSSSEDSVKQVFTGISFFESAIARLIQDETKIDPRRFFVKADQQGSRNISVTVTVLPDTAQGTESIESIVNKLSTNPGLLVAVRALQKKIIDHSPSMCIGKICPSGQVCILGTCASGGLGFVSEAPAIPQNPSNMRRILSSAPLITSFPQSPPIGNRELLGIVIGAGFLICLVGVGLSRVYKRMSSDSGGDLH